MMNKSFKSIATLVALGSVITLAACGGTAQNHHDEAKETVNVVEMPAEYIQGQKTLEIAQSFLMAAGSGDGDTLNKLMADDFVWHNEGDKSIPWIGNWEGKQVVFEQFMPAFGTGLKTTSWTTDYTFASGDQAVFMGSMSAIANNTGAETGTFSWAVRVNVEDGKVKSWNWFEDSFAVSKAYHAVQ